MAESCAARPGILAGPVSPLLLTLIFSALDRSLTRQCQCIPECQRKNFPTGQNSFPLTRSLLRPTSASVDPHSLFGSSPYSQWLIPDAIPSPESFFGWWSSPGQWEIISAAAAALSLTCPRSSRHRYLR